MNILYVIKLVLRFFSRVLIFLIFLIVANAYFLPKLSVSLILPNGAIISRPFEIRQYRGEHSLYAKNGKTLLSRNIEFICFNDNYVKVSSYDQGEGGIFGAQLRLDAPNLEYAEIFAISGLNVSEKTCDGYYTGLLGPGLLYEGNEWPFLPSCDWRNFENLALKDRSWFDRPCAKDLPPRFYSSNPAKAR